MTPVTLREDSWAAMSYVEVREIAAADGSILAVPVGSIEQHGHHLPTVTDSALADAIAGLGAERVRDRIPIVTAPTVWSGYSPMHLDSFGGTLSLTFEHLRGLLEDVGRTGLENGFDALVFVNGHGGNGSVVDGAVSTLGASHPDAVVLGLTYYHLAESFIEEIRESDPGGMSHGGEFETSLMMHLYPDLVNEERVEGENRDMSFRHAAADLVEGGAINVYRSSDAYSDSGAEGDPTLATPEKGEAIYDLLGDEMEGLLCDVHENAK